MGHNITWEDNGVTIHPLIKANSFEYTESSNSASNMRFGACCARTIKFRGFYNANNPAPLNATLTYYDRDGNYMGKFYAQTTLETSREYSVIAYDEIIKLDVDFSAKLKTIQSEFPMSVRTLLSYVGEVAGVDINAISNITATGVNAFYADGITCRKVVSWVAEMFGTFVKTDPHIGANDEELNTIVFSRYTTVSSYRIAPSGGTSQGVTNIYYKMNGLDYSPVHPDAVDAVRIVVPDSAHTTVTYPPNVETGNIYIISNNQLCNGLNYATLNLRARTIFDSHFDANVYTNFRVKLFPFNCPFKTGDKVNVVDKNGGEFTACIMNKVVTDSEVVLSASFEQNYKDGDQGTATDYFTTLDNNSGKLLVKDSNGNTVLSVDASAGTVEIAGWTVNKDGFIKILQGIGETWSFTVNGINFGFGVGVTPNVSILRDIGLYPMFLPNPSVSDCMIYTEKVSNSEANIHVAGNVYANNVPVIETGSKSCPISSNAITTTHVNFTKAFSSAPSVVACYGGTLAYASDLNKVCWSVRNITATGFDLDVGFNGSIGSLSTLTFRWQAIGT